MNPPPPGSRVAIVGTGISGLVCAHRLHRDQALTLFEAGAYAGGHTHTIPVERGGQVFPVDTGSSSPSAAISSGPPSTLWWAASSASTAKPPTRPRGGPTLTYNMNLLQSLKSASTFCVSLNQREAIAPASRIAEMTYHHPRYTVAAVRAQGRRAEINGVNHTYYCGAYWG